MGVGMGGIALGISLAANLAAGVWLRSRSKFQLAFVPVYAVTMAALSRLSADWHVIPRFVAFGIVGALICVAWRLHEARQRMQAEA